MKISSNPDIEEFHFRRFRSQYQLPEGIVSYGDKPDVVIRGEKSIGIEITNFYKDQSGTEESEVNKRRATIEKAQSIYQKCSKSKIEYTFSFSQDHRIQNVNQLAKKISDVAKSLEDHPVGAIPRSFFKSISELSYVYRGEEYPDCKWNVCRVFSTPPMSEDSLIHIIRKKEKKALQYSGYDSLWLLIVVDFINPSQDQEIQNVRVKEVESNVFEKIIIYRTAMEHVREIPIKALPLFP